MNKVANHCSARQVCDELLALLSLYKSHMLKLAEEHGLTMMQLHALRVISEGSNTTSAIAKGMHCDASNVTGIVDRLLALSLVTRQENPQDRRIKTIALTDEGSTLLVDVMAEMPTRLGCDRLAQTDLDAVHAAVQRLHAI